MADSATTFLVSAYRDPVIVQIKGRADYMNSQPLANFFHEMVNKGRCTFVIDFASCTTVDSTFLGILASAALEVEEKGEGHCIVLTRLGERHLELVYNLGLDNILSLDTSGELNYEGLQFRRAGEPIEAGRNCSKETILKAHEALCDVDEGNVGKFQDVIAFLKNQVDGSTDRA
ncbi:MAG: STAS domain-containing protein [Verrucomicrobiota bacterium]